MKKTYKREVAKVLILWAIYISIWGSAEVLSIMIWPVFLFVGAAYGMDWASKQTSLVDKVVKDGE